MKLPTSRMLLRGMLCIHTSTTSTEDVETRGLQDKRSQSSLHKGLSAAQPCCKTFERRPSEEFG